MTLHDEITAEMHAHATAETGGVSLHEWTCGYLWSAAQRSADYEEQRRQRRETEPAFAAAERARWKRANDRRAAKRRRAKRFAEVDRRLALHPAMGETPCPPESTSQRPTRPATSDVLSAVALLP